MQADDTVETREGARADKAKQARQLEIDDLRWLMNSSQGRRVALRLLDMTGLRTSSFTGNSETFFKEGRRSVGLEFERQIANHCFSEYLLMLKEHQERNTK